MTNDSLPGTNAAKYGPGDRLIAMQAAHDAFRRDLERMARVATPANLRDPGRRQSILNGWAVFENQLLIHHKHEDRFLWPRLRQRMGGSAAAMSTLDAMDAEHALIDPLLEAVNHSFAHDGEGAGEIIEEMTDKLGGHLGHEEREAMPMIGEALSDAEWKAVVSDIRKATKLSSAAQFMPWLSEGVDAEGEKTILSIMPPPARVVYRRVWKPKYTNVSRW
jgi:iron-sulfur cluster repair protein YtfE (RIC family)